MFMKKSIQKEQSPSSQLNSKRTLKRVMTGNQALVNDKMTSPTEAYYSNNTKNQFGLGKRDLSCNNP